MVSKVNIINSKKIAKYIYFEHLYNNIEKANNLRQQDSKSEAVLLVNSIFGGLKNG